MKITYLIVPAWTDQSGQCRIVSKVHDADVRPGLKDYRENPAGWKEAGIMNSRGQLVCLESAYPSHSSHQKNMRRDQPLMAGVTYTFEVA